MSDPSVNVEAVNIESSNSTISSDAASSKTVVPTEAIDTTLDQNASVDIPRFSQQVMEEYITQFFGFTPKAFCDSIYNAMYDALHDGIDAFQGSLLTEFKNLVTEEELCIGSEKILETVIPKAEKSSEKLETYLMKNIFFIPNGMLLPEDEIHKTMSSKSEDEKLLDRKIESLEKEILNGHYTIQCLQQKKLEIDTAITEYTKMCSLLDEMEKIYADHGISGVSDVHLVKDRVTELAASIEEITTVL